MQSIRQLSGVSLLFGGAVVFDWGTVTLPPIVPQKKHISRPRATWVTTNTLRQNTSHHRIPDLSETQR
jgi:hypothetical protein